MSEYSSFLSVIEKYGLSLYSISADDTPITALDNHSIVQDFLKDLYNERVFHKSYPREQFLRDSIGLRLLNSYNFKITDLNKWIEMFGISRENIPFPKEYLLAINFTILFPDDSPSSLITCIADTHHFCEYMGKSKEEIFNDICSTYKLNSVFLKEEAQFQADLELWRKIDVLDKLPNEKCLEQFKQELVVVALETVKRNIEKDLLAFQTDF